MTDTDYEVVLRSPMARQLTAEQKATDTVLSDENTRLFRKAVPGGYAYWQMDLTEENRINEELRDVAEALEAEKEILQLENELKEKIAKIDAKSKVYDDISVKVLPQSRAIARLVEQARSNPSTASDKLRTVCVYAVYIKRMSNLMLMASERERLDRGDLWLAICETGRYLSKKGVIAGLYADESHTVYPADRLVDLYAAFEAVVEASLPTMQAIHINMIGNELKITVEGATPSFLPEVPGTVETEDDVVFIRLSLGEGESV